MELLLQGKTAIVTGAARGLGRSISFMLAKEGVNVVLVGIDSCLIEKVVDEVKYFGSQAPTSFLLAHSRPAADPSDTELHP